MGGRVSGFDYQLPERTVDTKIAIPVRRTAYLYILFSSQKQEQGDSLRRQTKAAPEFCEHFAPAIDSAF